MKQICRVSGLILLFLLTIKPGLLLCQNTSISTTLDYINMKLAGKCKVDVKNGYLLAEFTENGSVIRKDKVGIEDLDPEKTEFSEESGMIILYCKVKECAERKLMGNTKVTQLQNNVPILFSGDKAQAASVMKAFNHLIRTINEPNYKNNTSFE